MNVDGAPDVPVEARVEEFGGILQRRTLEEVSFTTDLYDSPCRCPRRGTRPECPSTSLLHDIRIGFPDEGAILASVSPLQSPSPAIFSLMSLEAAGLLPLVDSSSSFFCPYTTATLTQ